MGARSTACKDSAFFPMWLLQSLMPKRPLTSSSQPGLPWLWHRQGAQQGQRHFIAVSSLLSQAVPASLTPRAGSVGKLNRKGVLSTLWLPKLRMTFSNPDRFSFASLTSLILGQMVKPCIFEGGRLRAGSVPLFCSASLLPFPHLGTPCLRYVCS